MDKQIEKYISIVPSKRQKSYQETGFNVFFHYGMNTFMDSEWGDGKAPSSNFNPKAQDTDQWIKAIKDAGAKGAILTCKHHDGFCLWPTKTTEYSVKNSPYKNGKGDVVKEVSESCKKYGIRFGVYLSPWDRNSEYYATPKYNDFYIEQLTELLTNYGEIFCVWLDGACGSHLDGKPKQKYDFERIYATVRKLQPNACISSCGPDIRWVGNEGGHTRKSEWSVIPAYLSKAKKIAEASQQNENGKALQHATHESEDLGSRKVLSKTDKLIWYPAEVDFSIHKGWFFHENDERHSLRRILTVYYKSIGGNCTLLLNVPPDKNGLISNEDLKTLKDMGEEIKKAFERKVKIKDITADESKNSEEITSCLDNTQSYWAPIKEKKSYKIKLTFKNPTVIDKLVLKEQCNFSQRVESFKIYAHSGKTKKKVYNGTIIGFNKIAVFSPVKADAVTIEITKCRSTPHLRTIEIYEENGGIPRYSKKELIIKKIKREKERYELKKWRRYQAKIEKEQEKNLEQE